MLDNLIIVTALVLVLPTVYAYLRYGDVFHPLIFIAPMALTIYVYMPITLKESAELFTYLTPSQAEFAQTVIVVVLIAFMAGCLIGSGTPKPRLSVQRRAAPAVLIKFALYLGSIGFAAWLFMIRSSGGLQGAFGQAYGGAWSDIGYIRDAAFLLLVGILLLLTPEAWRHRSGLVYAAVGGFIVPWLLQGVLGARRGPTFLVAIGVGMSWYLARGKRPSIPTLGLAGVGVGLLMLFLVANRRAIYLGSDAEFTTDIGGVVTEASTANEYVFGAGCINASAQTGQFFWGKRILAQVFIRPIPRQIWPTKYEDFGVPELLQNAGVAGATFSAVMGWSEVPGAAAAMVADLWVEFSWLAVPAAGLIGWFYGYCWRRAVSDGQSWNTQYTILMMLSVYLVTQSMEAVIFRLLILSIPIHFVWRRAMMAVDLAPYRPVPMSGLT